MEVDPFFQAKSHVVGIVGASGDLKLFAALEMLSEGRSEICIEHSTRNENVGGYELDVFETVHESSCRSL